MSNDTRLISSFSRKKEKKPRPDRYNVDALKERLKDDGTALDVFTLAGVPSELVEHARNTGRERGAGVPCPICGGVDRFKLVRSKDGGAWLAFCRQCDAGGRSYTPLDFYQSARGLDLNAAVRELVDALDGSTLATPKNALTIQTAPATSAEQSTHGRRVVPESEAEKRTTDYIYSNAGGVPVFNARRVDFYDKKTGERVAIDRNGATLDKSILSLVPDGATWKPSKGLDRLTIPPYNLPRLLAAECQTVYVVEGERAADRLNGALESMEGEAVATTTGAAANAGHWKRHAPQCLTGKIVYVLSDNDAPGRKAAATIAEAATAADACGVFLVDFSTRPDGTHAPTGYDVTDYLDDLDRIAPELIPIEQINARAVQYTPAQREPDSTRKEQDAPTAADDPDPVELRREREALQQRRADERETLLTLPPYPAEAIPETLLEYARFYAEKFSAPVSTAVKQALSNFSGLVARLYPMTAPAVGYTETRPLRCNFAALTVADSGAGKSPLFNALLEPITDLQRRIEEQQARLIAQFKDDLQKQDAAKSEKKKFLAKLKRTDNATKREAIETQLDELDEILFKTLEEPREQQELYFDPETPEGTLEGIEKNLLNGYQNAPIIATDEGVTMFQTTYNPLGTLAAFKKYSQLYDGARFKVKLKTKKASGDNSNPAPRFASFNLCIQPEVLAECFKNDVLRKQGLLNRFVVDEQTPTFSAGFNDSALDDATRKRYFLPFERAFSTCQFYAKHETNTDGGNDLDAEPTPPKMRKQTYTLDENAGTAADPSALDVFKEFFAYCWQKQETFYRAGNLPLFSFYAKLREIVLKYAVLFRTWEALEQKPGAFVSLGTSNDWLPFPTIDAAMMKRAVDVATWDGLKREAVGALVDSLNDDGAGASLPIPAQKILERLADNPEKQFTKTELVNGLHWLTGRKNSNVFKRTITQLIERGLIRETKEKRGNNFRALYQYVQIEPERTIDDANLFDDGNAAEE